VNLYVAKIIIGRFGQSYGIKGWIKVNSLTDPISNILQYSPWQIQHQNVWREIKITQGKHQGNNIIVKLADCNSPEEAKIFTNDLIAIEREQLPVLSTNEYYWTDLIGLSVINQDGVNFGVVDSLLETGSNDVLIVKGLRQRLLPYTDNVIIKIDLTQKIITVNWDPDF